MSSVRQESPTTQLVEKAENLASNVLPACLFMVHNTGRCGENNESERARRKHIRDPTFDLVQRHTEARRHNTTLVDAAVEFHDNLAGAVVIDDVEVADVACLVRHDSLRTALWHTKV